MKSYLSSLLLIMAAQSISGEVLGQGLLFFANNSNTLVTTNTVGGSGPAPLSSISGIEIQLFYQAGGNPRPYSLIQGDGVVQGGWEPMQGAPLVTIATTPGRFNGGTETTGSDVAPGGSAWLTAVAWTGGYSSLQAALLSPDSMWTESVIWSQATGSGFPANITGANEFSGMGIEYDSPEPGTCGLILCGAAVIGLVRWKRGASLKSKVYPDI